MYIHERNDWTQFRWDDASLSSLIEEVGRKQGILLGRLSGLGFDSKLKAMAENVTMDIVYSSEIEGVKLNTDEVRSSVARKMGIENIRYTAPSHYVDSVVAVMIDAVQHYNQPLTKDKLCAWQSAFFPTGYSEGVKIEVGKYRTNEEHIVSGMFGREKVHYIAPSPSRVEEEMSRFIEWFNQKHSVSSVIESAVAHFWFVSIHPFEDGNGRLARILSDMILARGDKSEFRFYNISSQINKDKKRYYEVIERAQSGNGDLTEWILWYVKTLLKSFGEANALISATLNKSLFWQRNIGVSLSERQIDILNKYLDGYDAKINTKNWANLAKCSKDTAQRDIQDLVAKNILRENIPGAKRPVYSIVYSTDDISDRFSETEIIEKDGAWILKSLYMGRVPIEEPIHAFDADLFAKGEMSLSDLAGKYCAYMVGC